jgi:hypothetical protein
MQAQYTPILEAIATAVNSVGISPRCVYQVVWGDKICQSVRWVVEWSTWRWPPSL